MHYAALVTSLSLSLSAAPEAAESAAHVDVSASMPAAPEDFLASLQAPVTLENVRAEVADGWLDISFHLRDVGNVSVTVLAEEEGSGRGVVMVDYFVVTEVEFTDGAVAREASDFSSLSPAQALTVAAGLVQVWHEDAVTEALHDRDLKCTVAGKIAGSTIGLAVFAGCGLATKSPKCYGYGYGVLHTVSGYITNKCNGAQNK